MTTLFLIIFNHPSTLGPSLEQMIKQKFVLTVVPKRLWLSTELGHANQSVTGPCAIALFKKSWIPNAEHYIKKRKYSAIHPRDAWTNNVWISKYVCYNPQEDSCRHDAKNHKANSLLHDVKCVLPLFFGAHKIWVWPRVRHLSSLQFDARAGGWGRKNLQFDEESSLGHASEEFPNFY